MIVTPRSERSGANRAALPSRDAAIADAHGHRPPAPASRRSTSRPSLGFQFADGDNLPVRVPVVPQRADAGARRTRRRVIEALPDHRVRVTVRAAEEPTQIAVDPDQVLEDAEPANNYWKPRERWRWTPLYTQLEETDLMNDYDRWNFIVGPWVYASATRDPWFQRSSYAGLRLGAYRTQQFAGGAYAALRSDYRDLVVGADGLIDHWPLAEDAGRLPRRAAGRRADRHRRAGQRLPGRRLRPVHLPVHRRRCT